MVKNPERGEALEDGWEGARGVHFRNDSYRLIWEVDDRRETVVVLRVNKKQRLGSTIYQEPRPTTLGWPPEGSDRE